MGEGYFSWPRGTDGCVSFLPMLRARSPDFRSLTHCGGWEGRFLALGIKATPWGRQPLEGNRIIVMAKKMSLFLPHKPRSWGQEQALFIPLGQMKGRRHISKKNSQSMAKWPEQSPLMVIFVIFGLDVVCGDTSSSKRGAIDRITDPRTGRPLVAGGPGDLDLCVSCSSASWLSLLVPLPLHSWGS